MLSVSDGVKVWYNPSRCDNIYSVHIHILFFFDTYSI